jgi:hypothetical protein
MVQKTVFYFENQIMRDMKEMNLVDQNKRHDHKRDKNLLMAVKKGGVHKTGKTCSFCHKGNHSVETCCLKYPT